jgi:hypothetical protein
MILALRGALPALVAATALAAGAGPAAADDKVTYENTIKEILADRCLRCHGAGAPTLAEFDKDKEGWKRKFKGPRLDSYASVAILVNGTDAGAVMRRLDDGKSTKDGKPGNMYAFLGSSDHERAERLDKFKKWVGSWSLKRRKELSESELGAITAPER